MKWLEQVIVNNPAKFIIIGTHAPVNEAGTDYNRPFMNILEKYSVDLVLAGHYHSESFKTLYQDKKPENPQMGVTYMRGEGGGVKAVGDADPEEFAKGYIIDVLDDSIQIRYINAKGTILQTKTFKNYKLSEKEDATKDELISSINATFDVTKQTAKFTWSSKFFKNVSYMTIKEAYREERQIKLIFPTPGYTTHTFDKMNPIYDNKYIIDIAFADGTTETKVFQYLKDGRMGLVANNITATGVDIEFNAPSSSDLNIMRSYVILVNGIEVATLDAKDVDGKPNTKYSITGLTSNTSYDIVIQAHSRYGILYTDEKTILTK